MPRTPHWEQLVTSLPVPRICVPLPAPLPSISRGWNWVRSWAVVVQGRSTNTALLSLVSLGNLAKTQGRTRKEGPHTTSIPMGAVMQGALQQHTHHRPLPTMVLAQELLHQPEDAAHGQGVPCKTPSSGSWHITEKLFLREVILALSIVVVELETAVLKQPLS